MKNLLLAMQFLTIVPVSVSGNVTAREIGRSAAFFPLAGALQGLFLVLGLILFSRVFPPDITAGLLVVLLAFSSGGFDLDGLADTADALAVKSSGNRETDIGKRLRVMKDSSTGSIGVAALIFVIILKYLFMKSLIIDLSFPSTAGILFLMPAFSKWITVPPMFYGISARNDGLGKIFIENAGMQSLLISSMLMITLCLAVVVSGFFISASGISMSESLGLCVLMLILFYLISLISVRFFHRIFGGLTGDHFGALTEVSEIIYLGVAYVWLRHSF
ncbi:MAG: adenosylcobinamide-GDP ribazoletransferase [Nitrospiraceae bacterium]|nr:adenosylcobinamide-GDP ribazoletransferase [Nitrospiraceae bacterium]